MDYFFDKLSDRINASQDRGSGRDYEQGAQAQAAAVDNSELERIIDERLALYKDQIVEEIKSGVAQSVSDSNAMCVEMISQSAHEGNTARLSAIEEIMAALASTKSDLADVISMNGHATKEDLTEIIAGFKTDEGISQDVISDIADEVAHRVRQDQGAPVSEEGIAEAVAAALAVSMAAPASKEEIADEVAASLSSTLDSHKLEISDIADAVAEKVRENQAVPVSEEEIARILSEKLQENRTEPVSKEEIAQIVAEKIQENKTTPVSKEDIAAAVAADMAVTLAAQKLEISDIADAVARRVQADQTAPVTKEEIAQIVAGKIAESKETPITKEEIAQIVAEKIQENKTTPVSKEDIAAAVVADLGVTLAAQKLEISDIADAVAKRVQADQTAPVTKDEIAQIVAEKIAESKETPITKEEIAQAVAEKIQENKETPVSKEELVSAVENVVSAKLSAMPHLSKSDIVTAMTVAWASNKTDIVDSVNEGFEKADIGVAKVVDATGSDVKQELNEKIDRTSEELSDHVHKECVKVYKNVQAVLEEGLQHQKEEIDADAASREKNLRDIVDVSINTALRDNQKSESDNTKNIINDTVSSLLKTTTGDKLSTIKNMMLAIICMLGINLLGILVIILWIFQII